MKKKHGSRTLIDAPISNHNLFSIHKHKLYTSSQSHSYAVRKRWYVTVTALRQRHFQ